MPPMPPRWNSTKRCARPIPIGGPLYDSMMAFQNEHFLWQQVTEQTFTQFIMAKQQAGELPAQAQ